MALQVPVSANTRPMEKQILAALNKNYKVNLQTRGFSQPLGKITGQIGEFEKSLEASNARVIAFGASAGAIVAVQKALKNTVAAAINVEKKLADINVILNASSSSLAKFGDQLFKIAGQTGQSFDAVADAAAEFARQGLGLEKTLLRTRDALILTRLSGLDVVSSVNSLTAAINSFGKAALNSTEVVNKLANVDAAFAISSADLANALTRVGSAAEGAGVSFDELLAIVTAAQQTTARGGAVIGNSFKTIFTRIQRPRTLEELEKLGITVRNLQGEVKPAIQILGDLAKRFDTLQASQRSQVAELVGGVFQINILKAALSDLNKEYSIFDNALETSLGSTDQAIKRNQELNKTLSALINDSLARFTKIGAEIGGGTIAPAIRNILEFVNKGIDLADSSEAGKKLGEGLLSGFGKFISGPGLALAGVAFTKIFLNLTQFAVDAFKSIQNLNVQSGEQRKIQQGITQLLSEQPQLLQAVTKGTVSAEGAANLVLKQYQAQQKVLTENARLVKFITSAAVGKNISKKTTAGGSLPRYAGGSIEDLEKRDARRGGYVSGEVVPSPIGGVMNTAETIAYDNRFSQPFINPPEDSNAGRSHKRKSINKLGIDPYALPQIGFAAGGATPEGYNYPFRVLQRGKPRPIDPKDVVKRSREYELQLLNGGLAKLGFSDVKDLNAVFGSNSEADFFATKNGRPYLVDAKAGFNDAKESQMLKKQGTINSLRQTAKYRTYLESLGYSDADIRTAIVFGNAQTQQQKTLRKKGILRNASGNFPNYNGGSTPSAKSKAEKAKDLQKRVGAGRVFENSIGLAAGIQKKYIEDNETLDYKPDILNIDKEVKERIGLAKRTYWGDAKIGDNERSLSSYISKLIRSGAKVDAQGKVTAKRNGGVILPNNNNLSKKDRYVTHTTTGQNLININKSIKGKVDPNQNYTSRIFKDYTNVKLGDTYGARKSTTRSRARQAGKISRQFTSAKGSIPNFANGGGGGGGEGFGGKALTAAFTLPLITESVKSFAGEASTTGKSLDAFADAVNAGSTTFFALDLFGKKLGGKFRGFAVALTALGGLSRSLNLNFGEASNLTQKLNSRLEETSELQQKFNDSSSVYLSSLDSYTQALEDGSDTSTVVKRFKAVEEALQAVPAAYRAQVAGMPDFDSLKEEVARIQKELARQKGLDETLAAFAKASGPGFFASLNPFGSDTGNIFDNIKSEDFAKSLVGNVNPEKLFKSIAGGGVEIDESISRALAGEDLNAIISAFGITGEKAKELSETLSGTPVDETTAALKKFLEELVKDKNLTKLTSALLKEKSKILSEYSQKVKQARDNLKQSSLDIGTFASNLSDIAGLKDTTQEFIDLQRQLQSGKLSKSETIEGVIRLREIASQLGGSLDPEIGKKFLRGYEDEGAKVLRNLSSASGGFFQTGKDLQSKNLEGALRESILGIKDGAATRALDQEREDLFGVTAATQAEQVAKERLAEATQELTKKFEDLPDQINTAVASLRGTAGVASGFVPNFATATGERIAAKAGGYTAGAIKHVNVPGVGRVMANGAETVKQFPGMSQPAIMPPSFSKAGRNYAKAFSKTHGFDPYAAEGFVPNFAAKGILSLAKKFMGASFGGVAKGIGAASKKVNPLGKAKGEILNTTKQLKDVKNEIRNTKFTGGSANAFQNKLAMLKKKEAFLTDQIQKLKNKPSLSGRLKSATKSGAGAVGGFLTKQRGLSKGRLGGPAGIISGIITGLGVDALLGTTEEEQAALKQANESALFEDTEIAKKGIPLTKGAGSTLLNVAKFSGIGAPIAAAGEKFLGATLDTRKAQLEAKEGPDLGAAASTATITKYVKEAKAYRDSKSKGQGDPLASLQQEKKLLFRQRVFDEQIAALRAKEVGGGGFLGVFGGGLSKGDRTSLKILEGKRRYASQQIADLKKSDEYQSQKSSFLDFIKSEKRKAQLIEAAKKSGDQDAVDYLEGTRTKKEIELDRRKEGFTNKLIEQVGQEAYNKLATKYPGVTAQYAMNGDLNPIAFKSFAESFGMNEDAYKERVRQFLAEASQAIQAKRGGAALGFVPSFAGGEVLAKRTERRLTGSAIRSFDPRIGTYYRSAGQPANLDSLIRRDHPEGLSQAIRNSYATQTGSTPNFAVAESEELQRLVEQIKELISLLREQDEPQAAASQNVTVGLEAALGDLVLNVDASEALTTLKAEMENKYLGIINKLKGAPGAIGQHFRSQAL